MKYFYLIHQSLKIFTSTLVITYCTHLLESQDQWMLRVTLCAVFMSWTKPAVEYRSITWRSLATKRSGE